MPKYSQQDMQRQSGTVVKWMPDKGFGFIRGDDGAEYFFHRSGVQDVDRVQTLKSVTFVQTQGPKGPRAEDVILDS